MFRKFLYALKATHTEKEKTQTGKNQLYYWKSCEILIQSQVYI